MTDTEIIKALECCLINDITYCGACAYSGCYGNCVDELMRDALSLINRQKAEVERLKKENKLLTDKHPANTHSNCVTVDNGLIFTKTLDDYDKLIGDISSEAIKEFAERLKADIVEDPENPLNSSFPVVTAQYVDDLVKEMVGDNNG